MRNFYIGLVLGVALLVGYAGAYYAAVDQIGDVSGSMIDVNPTYDFGSEAFFLPMHLIDRMVRPIHWQSQPLILPR